jgi:serine/threonine protein phosphatase Stp1
VSTAVASNRAQIGFTWRSFSATSTGNVRSHNEDAILERPEIGLWVVADGMGGHNAGDIASSMIVDALASVARHRAPSAQLDEIEDRLRSVNYRLYQASIDDHAGMSGSTVVALLAFERHCLSVWAGDSRAYRCRAAALEQVTLDHSEVQELRDVGVDTAHVPDSNVITRAVGGSQDLHLDIELRELQNQDRYLLCSDGLYREVPAADLARHLAGNDPEGACKALMSQALRGPCSDNVSAIVVQFNGP